MFHRKELDKLFIISFPGIEELSKRANKSPLEWACEKIEMCIKLENEMISLKKDYPIINHMDTPIDEILSCRFHEPLISRGYKTLADLANASALELYNIKGIGRGALFEIRDALALVGIIKDIKIKRG